MSSSELDEALRPLKKLLGEKDVAIASHLSGQNWLKAELESVTVDRESWRKACVQWEEDYYKLSERAKAAEVDRDQWKKSYEEYSGGSIPRFITIDELEEGQWIASLAIDEPAPFFGGKVTKVYAMDEGGRHIEINGEEMRYWFSREVGVVYLLEEAPRVELPKPELRPNSPGERVHLTDLKVGDVIDSWHKRSGGFFLRENLKVQEVREDGTVLMHTGIVFLRDTGWGEIRRK